MLFIFGMEGVLIMTNAEKENLKEMILEEAQDLDFDFFDEDDIAMWTWIESLVN